ncbi:hypothetical protein QVD99_007206 [Batrachochytrium dendrobatidis]|nr:hypothetical protein O5D80_007518 [Batrachochytrium dendrobatidis]KAK5666450.1 hypothetical protein QVD99_007206 [Batrachochytrium dendrobatidis]
MLYIIFLTFALAVNALTVHNPPVDGSGGAAPSKPKCHHRVSKHDEYASYPSVQSNSQPMPIGWESGLKNQVTYSTIQPLSASSIVPEVNPNLDFFIIGDWGQPNERQSQVAKVMSDLAYMTKPDFVLSVGDNFYATNETKHDGVLSTNDSKWNDFWLKVYQGFTQSIPWYSVLGNHDWLGDPQSQIEYSKLNPTKWVMPNYFWERTVKLGQHEVAFIMIDTNYLVYSTMEIRPIMLNNFQRAGWTDGNQTVKMHLDWIEGALQRHLDKKYVFVVGHHFLGTCKPVGHMVELQALLDKYQPTAYLYGHHHTLQATSRGKTQYIQSGAGSVMEDSCPDHDGWALGQTNGFVHASVTEASIVFNFWDYTGKIVHTVNA